MPKIEKRIISAISNHLLSICVAMVTIVTLYVRFCFRDFITMDMRIYLLEWFKQISNEGGMHALKQRIGDYNIVYQTIIALFTYLPVKPEYMYKGLSVLFDYLLAWSAAQIVFALSKNKVFQVITYCAMVSLPFVVLNSAAWGQCDSIYVFFCILSILMLIREKHFLSLLAYAVAFAFKLQAIFLMPLFLVLLFLIVLIIYKTSTISGLECVKLAFIISFTCVLFIPAMHERYSYLYMIIGMVLAVLDNTTIPAYLCLICIDLQGYGNYLFQLDVLSWKTLAFLNVMVYVYYVCHLMSPYLRQVRGLSIRSEDN